MTTLYRPVDKSDEDKLNKLTRILQTKEWTAAMGERVDGTRQLGSEPRPGVQLSTRMEGRIRRPPDQPAGLPGRVRQERERVGAVELPDHGITQALDVVAQSRSPMARPRRKTAFEPEVDFTGTPYSARSAG